MKHVKFLFSLMAFGAIIFFSSCSKTRDGLGLDTINNAATTGRWEVMKILYVGDIATETNLTAGNAYAEFKKSDNKVHYYDANGVDDAAKATTYSFLDTKRIMYGGNEYTIQENLAGSFSKMTLQRNTGANTREVYIFQRP